MSTCVIGFSGSGGVTAVMLGNGEALDTDIAVIGIGMIVLRGRDKSAPMPFGPFLAGAGFIMIIWGPQLSAFYMDNIVG